MRISLPQIILTACSVFCAAIVVPAAQAQFDDSSPSGPIDIHADEQEFAGDSVIARGHVRVLYKDSVITGPTATLTRDPLGNPQKAVFTGHPHLTQGTNNVDANTLIFDIVNSKVIADGNAHSEVLSQGSGDTAGGAQKPKEKIITDSDRQEYDKAGGKFEATGHVRVNHGDIKVASDKLSLVYGTDQKPETAVFTGHVNAQQGKNSTTADTMTYFLSTQRLQATGNVKSKVIQDKKDEKGNVKKFSFFDTGGLPVAQAKAKTPVAPPAAPVGAPVPGGKSDDEETIIITSESQDYAKDSGKMTAIGNVKVYYQDTIGAGPKVILFRNAEGKAEKVNFIGRSQISQPGRRWIADAITFIVADRKVLAQGNTKAYILQTAPKGPQPAGRPANGPGLFPGLNNSRMAETPGRRL